MNRSASHSRPLPVRNSLTAAYAATIGIAALMASASIAGLLYPSAVYPTDELRQAFVPNDAVNLAIGLPILIGSMVLAARGRLIGLLFWPGALFFIFYNYLIYLFCMPFQTSFLVYLILAAAGAYTLIGLVAAMDMGAIRDRLSGAVPERLCGGVLAGLGALFLLRIVGLILGGPGDVTDTERALNAADFLLSPAWIIGGVLLWRRNPLGYAAGMGLLFSLSMLFIGLIAVMILQPVMTSAPFDAAGVLVVAVMGLVCFIPSALFLRGAVSARKESAADNSIQGVSG